MLRPGEGVLVGAPGPELAGWPPREGLRGMTRLFA